MSLDIKIKEQLNQYLTKIESAVSIDAFTNKEKASETMLDLLNYWRNKIKSGKQFLVR